MGLGWQARVTLQRSEKVRLVPHPEYDPTEFNSLASLALHTRGAYVLDCGDTWI